MEQFPLALEQVQAAPGGPLGWAVDFARQDPKKWLPGEAELHGYRLAAFALARPGVAVGHPAVIPRAAVLAAHAQLRATLRELVSASGVELPISGLRMALQRVPSPRPERAAYRMSLGGGWQTVVWYTLASLIAATDRLIACPQCKEPFLALHKMRFCSSKCAQDWHNDRKPRKDGRGRHAR